MSHWKLVEAEPESPVSRETTGQNQPQQQQQQPQQQNREHGGGRGRGRGRGGRGRGFSGPPRSKADRSYFAYLAVQQIDMIFNPDSLCMDTYVRSYMDEAGFVPIMFLMNYQNVASLGCSYYDVLHKLKETVSKTKYLELDAANELVRLKTDWEKFVMPNPYTGGMGLPRYRKQAPDAEGQPQPASHYQPQPAESTA